MKALRKGLLYAIVLLVVLGGLALIGVNLFLRSPGVREKVASAFEKRFGAEVSYEAISYLPWRGIKVTGLEMAHREDVTAITETPFFHADVVRAEVSLWTLTERPLPLGRIHVERPKLRTIQLADGSVALPWSAPASGEVLLANAVPPKLSPDELTEPPAEPPPTEPPPATTPKPEAGDPAPTQTPTVPTSPPPPPQRAAPPRVLLSEVSFSGGNMVLLGPNGNRSILTIAGITSVLDLDSLFQASEETVAGTLGAFKVERATLAGAFVATDVSGEFRVRKDGALALAGVEAMSDGGTVKGNFIADPRRRGFPFQAQLEVAGVRVAPIASRVTSRLSFSKGVLEGNLNAEGYLTSPQTWRGQGAGAMIEASLERNGLLESLGRYIGLREFVELEFHEATASFIIQGPVAHFQDIHWRTDNLEFKGLGAVGLNRQAKLAARLYFSERVRSVLQRIESQLPDKGIREVQQLEGREDYFRDFLILGPLSRLEANFIGSEGRTFEETLELIRKTSEPEPGGEGQS